MIRMCIWLVAACFGLSPVVATSRGVVGHPWHWGRWGQWGSGGYYPSYIVTPTGIAPLPSTSFPGVLPTTTTTFRPTFPPLSSIPGGTNFPLIDPRGPSTTALPLKLRDAEEISGPLYRDVIETNANQGGSTISFPREKRSTKRRQKRQLNCLCATIGTCTNGTSTSGTNFGSGLIDIRIVSGGGATCPLGTVLCCPSTSLPAPQLSCGSRIATTVPFGGSSGQAKYGDYPWMVVILTTDNMYVGGGTLIDAQHIITAAHRISSYPNGSGLKIRLGEWDASGTYEPYPYRDFTVSRVWLHESFNPNTLQNTIAVIRMAGSISPGTPGISPICMPTTGQIFDNQRCWVSGWGKDAFSPTSSFQVVLKAVDVPILSQSQCETSLRTTRLGTAFVLDRASFICAGGEASKDACTGDGGSGLVCETSPGRWTLAGMVAWGVGCATQGVPAAYVNVANYLSWISSKTASA